MRVLWLSTSKSLYKSPFNNNDYNGVGWVGALQLEVMTHSEIELAVAFITHDPHDSIDIQDGVHYYPIYKRNNAIDKLLYYHVGHRRWNSQFNIENVENIIEDFKPDLIQAFGFECPLADIIGHIQVPIVVHIQGIINPYLNSYIPPNMTISKIVRYGSCRREIILNNGFSFGYSNMKTLAYREKLLYSKCKYVCGRTDWDHNLAMLMAPQSEYFHVDELLRPEFFKAAQWRYSERKTKIIVSTISDNIYKGLDFVAKTAQVFSRYSDIDYQWQIIGISKESSLINIIEKVYKVNFDKLPIVFKGVQSAKEIVEILENADVYIHPSAIDNSPNSLCEAQLLGIPVIAANVGGISSLLPENSGILVPYNAPYELSEQIIKLFASSERALQIGTNGRITAQNRHNRDTIISQLISMYNQILRVQNG